MGEAREARARFPAVTSTRRVRVSAEILQQLKSAILGARLRPGDRLPPEKTLADRFHSSRGSVREAIRSLEESGLVVVRRGFGGGAFVADTDLRHVTDSLSTLLRLGKVSIQHLTEARLVLEPRLARLAAERVTEEELERMMDAETTRSNLAFHERLYEALKRHDAEVAGAIMLEHVLEVQGRLQRLLPQGRRRR